MSTAKIHPRGSVAIVTRGMILARYVPIAELDLETATNQDVRVIRPIEGIAPEIVLNSVRAQADDLFHAVSTAAHGTKRLETSALDELTIAGPDRSTQDRFVSASRVIRLHRTRLRRKRELLQELYDSLQYRAFRGEL